VAISLHSATSGSVAGLAETSLRALTKLQPTLPSRRLRPPMPSPDGHRRPPAAWRLLTSTPASCTPAPIHWTSWPFTSP